MNARSGKFGSHSRGRVSTMVPGEHSTPGRSSSAWIGKVGDPPKTIRGTGSPCA